MSSTFATTRSPAPIANRVSVAAGVRDTIRRGSAAIVTAVPSSSVMVTGNAGAGVGLGVAAGGGVGVVASVGAGDGDAAAPQAPRTRVKVRMSAAPRARNR